MESGSERSIRLLGPCRIREITVLAQLFALLTIIIVSLVNISLSDSRKELFIPLLTWAAGVLLPAPHEFLGRRHSTHSKEQHS